MTLPGNEGGPSRDSPELRGPPSSTRSDPLASARRLSPSGDPPCAATGLVRGLVTELATALDRFPWEQRVAYADWLAQTFHYVRHATRLLAAAAARYGLDAPSSELHERFAAHLDAEGKHARHALRDLRAIGASVADFAEHPATRMFYETQYYKIEYLHPVSYLGYILPLEGLGPACGRRLTERVAADHGDDCASFLRFHTQYGIEHFPVGLQLLEGLSAEERRLVEDNARQTAYAYRMMLLDIRYRVELPSRTRLVAVGGDGLRLP